MDRRSKGRLSLVEQVACDKEIVKSKKAKLEDAALLKLIETAHSKIVGKIESWDNLLNEYKKINICRSESEEVFLNMFDKCPNIFTDINDKSDEFVENEINRLELKDSNQKDKTVVVETRNDETSIDNCIVRNTENSDPFVRSQNPVAATTDDIMQQEKVNELANLYLEEELPKVKLMSFGDDVYALKLAAERLLKINDEMHALEKYLEDERQLLTKPISLLLKDYFIEKKCAI